MTSTFERSGDRIIWTRETGPIPFPLDQAENLLAIFLTVHDEMLREGQRVEARPIRRMILDLQDALKSVSQSQPCGSGVPSPHSHETPRSGGEPWPAMPRLEPITVQVRELNPELWRNVG